MGWRSRDRRPKKDGDVRVKREVEGPLHLSVDGV